MTPVVVMSPSRSVRPTGTRTAWTKVRDSKKSNKKILKRNCSKLQTKTRRIFSSGVEHRLSIKVKWSIIRRVTWSTNRKWSCSLRRRITDHRWVWVTGITMTTWGEEGRGGEGGRRKMNTYRHHLLKNEQNDLVVGESTHQQVVLYLTDWTVAGRTQLVGHSILVHQTLVQSCPTNGRAYQFLIFLLYIA